MSEEARPRGGPVEHLVTPELKVGREPRFLRTAAFKDYLLTGTGTTTARALSFLAVVLIGRWLGPEEFGRFSLAYFLMMIQPQLSAAIDNAIIKHIGAEPAEDRRFVFAAFALKLVVHGIICAIGLALAWPVVVLLLRKENFLLLYSLALVGGALTALFNIPLAHEQARSRFRAYVALSVGYSALWLLGACAVNVAGWRTAFAHLMWLNLLAAGAFVVWWSARGQRFQREAVRPHTRKLVHFGAWLGVATVAEAIYQRLDVFVLSAYADYSQLGVYSAAVRIAIIVDLFQRVILVVLFPKAMAVKDDVGLRRFFKESSFVTILAVSASAVAFVTAGWLLVMFFGREFSGAVASARLLCAANIVMLIYTPLTFVFYMFNRPQLMAVAGLIKLAAVAACALVLVPRFGAEGAALAMLLTNVVALGFVGVAALRLIQRSTWGGSKPSTETEAGMPPT